MSSNSNSNSNSSNGNNISNNLDRCVDGPAPACVVKSLGSRWFAKQQKESPIKKTPGVSSSSSPSSCLTSTLGASCTRVAGGTCTWQEPFEEQLLLGCSPGLEERRLRSPANEDDGDDKIFSSARKLFFGGNTKGEPRYGPSAPLHRQGEDCDNNDGFVSSRSKELNPNSLSQNSVWRSLITLSPSLMTSSFTPTPCTLRDLFALVYTDATECNFECKSKGGPRLKF
eukprot:jgi/Psemu1/40855/gm1.40855_g